MEQLKRKKKKLTYQEVEDKLVYFKKNWLKNNWLKNNWSKA
jgi:hypothetical protein